MTATLKNSPYLDQPVRTEREARRGLKGTWLRNQRDPDYQRNEMLRGLANLMLRERKAPSGQGDNALAADHLEAALRELDPSGKILAEYLPAAAE